jgi:hypothetical protein
MFVPSVFQIHRLAAVVLPQQVDHAIGIKVARRLDVPGRTGIAGAGAADQARSVHEPDRGLAAVVLQFDGGAVGLPSRVRIRRLIGAAVATCQLGPGLPTLPLAITLVPFNSQTTTSPLEF